MKDLDAEQIKVAKRRLEILKVLHRDSGERIEHQEATTFDTWAEEMAYHLTTVAIIDLEKTIVAQLEEALGENVNIDALDDVLLDGNRRQRNTNDL